MPVKSKGFSDKEAVIYLDLSLPEHCADLRSRKKSELSEKVLGDERRGIRMFRYEIPFKEKKKPERIPRLFQSKSFNLPV